MWLGALLLREHRLQPRTQWWNSRPQLYSCSVSSRNLSTKPKVYPWEGLGGSLKSQSCSVVPELVRGGITGNCLTCCDSFALRQRWSRRRWMEAQLHKPNWFKWLFKIQFISRTFMLDKDAGALRSSNTTLNGIMNNSISQHIKNNGMSPPEVLKYAPHTGWGPVLVDLMPVTLSHLCFQYNYCD